MTDIREGVYIPANEHFDIENLERRVAEGYISMSERPDMALFNYSPLAQYEGVWDREISASRGLVIRSDGHVQSRPLAKFFNLSEHAQKDELPPIPVEPFDVFEKVDGSMIAASQLGDDVLLTTRGSFQSDQAVAAKALWDARFSHVRIPEGETWCFEYIAPWNRIVIPYEEEDLVLLACISNHTGLDCRDIEDSNWTGPFARRFDGLDLAAIEAAMPDLPQYEEGYVLRFQSGLRVKAKGHAYVALHKICTNLSTRSVHEALASDTFDDLLEVVPDEFHPWLRDTESNLRGEFNKIRNTVENDLFSARLAAARMEPNYSRAVLAEYVKRTTYPGLCFGLEDSKDINPRIWDMIRPEREMAVIKETDEA